MTPFILRGRKQLPTESAPEAEHIYDTTLQVWIDRRQSRPLVECIRNHVESTQFGETTFTETREGADRTEGASIEASSFGETIQPQTREGVDRTEGSCILASQLGETVLTMSREGVDQSEGSKPGGSDASYSHF